MLFTYPVLLWNTALHAAAESGDIGVIKFLVSKGAELNTLNSHGESLLGISFSTGHLEAAKIY
jgi:ankyrin repeat protein